MADNSYKWLKSYPPEIKWNADIRAHSLFTLLDGAADKYPNQVAIDFLGRETSYAELADAVNKFAAGLQKLGIGKGVNVGIFMPNCPQFVISYYAILKTGATVVNYNPLYSVSELAHQIDDSASEIMITLSLKAIYPKLAQCLGKSKLKKIIVSDFCDALPLAKKLAFKLTHSNDISPIPNDNNHIKFSDLLESKGKFKQINIYPETDVAVLQYTGGTTGVPKAAVLTHANVYINTIQCGMWFSRLKFGEEVIMGALPLFHVFAMTIVMNLGIHTGSKMILHPKFDLKNILYDIHFKRPTLMPGVPTMFAAINNYNKLSKYDLTSLKMCISGGGPLPQEVKIKFEKITGCKLIEGYGLSESSPVVAANPLFGVNKAGSIGVPVPATIIEICDIENNDKPLGVGEVGEICVTAPQIMRGYLNNFAETTHTLRGGKLHTGDLGYMDEDGYFFVVDRLKEMIISGGYKIYPRNLEEVLYKHPDVLEAAVIGVSHPQRVQQPKVFIVRKEGTDVTEEEIKTYLKEHCSAYAVPHLVEFRDFLPKSIIGKILKKDLIAQEKAKK